MSKYSAVIDLGTNTFQLLIGFFDVNGLVVKENIQKPVQLGKGAMLEQIIQKEAIVRAKNVLQEFKEIIDQYGIKEVNALGTSIIRGAKNANELIHMIESEFNFHVHVISGQKEAELIFEGIVQSLPIQWSKRGLVMDIGGGSVEFILFEGKKIFWKHSFELGGLKLQSLFHHNFEFDGHQKESLTNYVINELEPLFKVSNAFKPLALIGAAGAFETIWDLEKAAKGNLNDELLSFQPLNLEIFYQHQRLIEKIDFEERTKIPGMKMFRASIFPYANVLIETVLKELSIQELYVSNYSLKEGFLSSKILSSTDA